MTKRLFLLWKRHPMCDDCRYLNECKGVFFIYIPKDYKCPSFNKIRPCEICSHDEYYHRIVIDDTGEHLMCDKCNSLCF